MGMYDFVFVYQRENKYLSRQVKALPQTNLSPKSPLTRGRQMKKAGWAQNAKRRVFESVLHTPYIPPKPPKQSVIVRLQAKHQHQVPLPSSPNPPLYIKTAALLRLQSDNVRLSKRSNISIIKTISTCFHLRLK